MLDKEAERKRRDEALTKVETPVETEEIQNGETEKLEENGVTEQNGEQVEEEKVVEEKIEEKAPSEEKSVESDKKDEKKKEKSVSKEEKTDPRINFKALVNDVDTFTAFTHFDQNICG